MTRRGLRKVLLLLSFLSFLSSFFFKSEKGLIMPDQITVSEFVTETNEDYKSPTASNFTTRMSHCRNTVAALEEVGDTCLYRI